MTRKKWVAKTEITPELLKFREKRKWQIALRRYVLEKNPSSSYAPYFGLDIEKLRKWFENQFEEGMSWDNFGANWQFEHIIPVAYFDFEDDSELKMCWNFINLRVESTKKSANRGNKIDLAGAKSYFKALVEQTQYGPCLDLLAKIEQIESPGLMNFERQHAFLDEHKDYLKNIEAFSSFEFELLNSGRSIADIQSEIDFLKKYSK